MRINIFKYRKSIFRHRRVVFAIGLQRLDRAADFLSCNGDGLFSVVVRTADYVASEHIAVRYGVKSVFRQRHEGDEFELTEVKLEPLFGIPLTLMSTDVADGNRSPLSGAPVAR